MDQDNWKIIGNSEKINEVLRVIEQVADTDVAVLIQGESGTGKELVARSIHYQSSHAGGDLVPVNCGAIPEGILESELFGHEKGAFTGAGAQRIGYFEMANEGTIFLDEIGEMSLQTQVNLLRVLETGRFLRVGGSKTVITNARVIAATNKELDKEAGNGNFREDLYYRLKTITINVPPLRERGSDIALLTDSFITELEKKYKLNNQEIAPEILDYFYRYPWPGNIRELKNVLESLILLKKGEKIEIIDLPENIKNIGSEVGGLPIHVNKTTDQVERELIYRALLGLRTDITDLKNIQIEMLKMLKKQSGVYKFEMPLNDVSEFVSVDGGEINDLSVEKVEAETIKEALRRFNGNRKKAANALGISERTLYRKLRKI